MHIIYAIAYTCPALCCALAMITHMGFHATPPSGVPTLRVAQLVNLKRADSLVPGCDEPLSGGHLGGRCAAVSPAGRRPESSGLPLCGLRGASEEPQGVRFAARPKAGRARQAAPDRRPRHPGRRRRRRRTGSLVGWRGRRSACPLASVDATVHVARAGGSGRAGGRAGRPPAAAGPGPRRGPPARVPRPARFGIMLAGSRRSPPAAAARTALTVPARQRAAFLQTGYLRPSGAGRVPHMLPAISYHGLRE
jgi:hypothetical protein